MGTSVKVDLKRTSRVFEVDVGPSHLFVRPTTRAEDVTLVLPEGADDMFMSGQWTDECLRRCLVRDLHGRERRVPPYDLFCDGRLREIDPLPNVTFTWLQIWDDAPGGELGLVSSFVDGRQVSVCPPDEWDAPPDLTTRTDYLDGLAVRTGEVTTAQLLDEGRAALGGDPIVALLLQGFLEDPGVRRAMADTDPMTSRAVGALLVASGQVASHLQ